MAEVSANLFLIPAGPKILAYHGDSTVWGANSDGSQVSAPPPSFVNMAGYTIQNQGLKGDSTPDALNGVGVTSAGPARPAWSILMAQSLAHIAIINYGINDRNANMLPATYKANLEQIADITKASGKMLILETPNPVSAPRTYPMSDYVQAMREVAVSRHLLLIDQFDYLTGVIGSNPITSYMPDGYHPNQATYQLKGEYANLQLNKWLCP